MQAEVNLLDSLPDFMRSDRTDFTHKVLRSDMIRLVLNPRYYAEQELEKLRSNLLDWKTPDKIEKEKAKLFSTKFAELQIRTKLDNYFGEIEANRVMQRGVASEQVDAARAEIRAALIAIGYIDGPPEVGGPTPYFVDLHPKVRAAKATHETISHTQYSENRNLNSKKIEVLESELQEYSRKLLN